MIEKVNKRNEINPKIRNSINGGLDTLNGLRDDLPFNSIDQPFRSFGLRLVQKDSTNFEAVFTGTEGQIKIPITEVNVDNTIGNFLVVS